MKTSKRLLALLLACICLFSLAACSKDGGDGEGSSGPGSNAGTNVGTDSGSASGEVRDTLNVAIASDPGSMDPGVQGGSEFFSVINCVMETLYDIDENNETIWLLAESIDEDSPTQWTVHLRKDVKFSNGNPFTADDVLFTLQHIKNSFGTIRTQSIDIDNCKVVDDHTFEMHFTEYNIQSRINFTELYIYDAESYDADSFGMNPIGTGPYVLKDYVLNSQVSLERRDDYWGETPAIKYINFKVLGETSQITNALETGMVDVGDVAATDLEYVSGMSEYTLQEYTDSQWLTVSFNPLENSPFSNVDARYAVAHLIDKQAIVDLVYGGNSDIMYGPVVKTAFDYHESFDNAHDTYTVGYDLELAKQYAESAGLAGSEISIITNGSAPLVTVAEMLKNRLSEIGVTATINNYDAATFIEVLVAAPEYDIVIQDYFVPNMYAAGSYTNGILFTPAYNVPGSWEGVDRYLEICTQSIYSPDEQVRFDVFTEMMDIFNDACSIYSVCELVNHRAFSAELEGPFVFRSSWGMRFADFKFAS